MLRADSSTRRAQPCALSLRETKTRSRTGQIGASTAVEPPSGGEGMAAHDHAMKPAGRSPGYAEPTMHSLLPRRARRRRGDEQHMHASRSDSCCGHRGRKAGVDRAPIAVLTGYPASVRARISRPRGVPPDDASARSRQVQKKGWGRDGLGGDVAGRRQRRVWWAKVTHALLVVTALVLWTTPEVEALNVQYPDGTEMLYGGTVTVPQGKLVLLDFSGRFHLFFQRFSFEYLLPRNSHVSSLAAKERMRCCDSVL